MDSDPTYSKPGLLTKYGTSKKLWACWINAFSVIICVCVFFHADSYGQTPTPTEDSMRQKDQSTRSKKPATKDQRGTETSPLVIKVAPSEKSEEETAQERKERDEKSTNERLLILANILLVVFTGILAIFTIKLWVSGKDTAERQLRAYVYVDSIAISLSLGRDNVIVSIKNFGKTPAYNISCMAVITFDPPATMPPCPPLERLIELFPARADIPPTGTFRPFLRNDFGERSMAEMQRGEKTLFLFGIIRYKDAFGKNRMSKFGYIYHHERAVAEGQWVATPEGNEST